ncbi:MAG: putative glycoside hydrolase [Thermoleophilaceae bacterium]
MGRGFGVIVALVCALAALLTVGAGATQRAESPDELIAVASNHPPVGDGAPPPRTPTLHAANRYAAQANPASHWRPRHHLKAPAKLPIARGPGGRSFGAPEVPSIPSLPNKPGGGSHDSGGTRGGDGGSHGSGGGSAPAPAPDSLPSSPGGGLPAASVAVSHHRMAINSSAPSGDIATTAKRNSFIFLVPWKTDVAKKLKAANPALKILMYKDASLMSSSSVGGTYSSGVGQPEADKAHPDWFLLTKAGQRFTSWSYSWLWAADIGNAGYQNQFASNVIAELKAHPEFDGVYLDDMNASIRHHHNPSDVMQYPNDTAYSGAMRSFVQTVSPKVHAAGKLVFANMGGTWAEYPDFNDEVLNYIDGGNDEFFLSWPGGSMQPQSMWDRMRVSIQRAEAGGKWFLGSAAGASSDDAKSARIMRYAYATTLLFGNGHTSFSLAKNYTDESWYDEFDYSLGKPLGDAQQQSSGIWTRDFENGTVAVNPSSSQSRSMAFKASYCKSASGPAVASTASTMSPQTGLILQRAC